MITAQTIGSLVVRALLDGDDSCAAHSELTAIADDLVGEQPPDIVPAAREALDDYLSTADAGQEKS